MASVNLPGTGGSITFKYDPFGRRIYKSSSSGTSIYAYDGENLIEETNILGAVIASYSQGFGIDEPLAMLRNSTTSFYQVDGLGSVTSLTNAAGALANTYAYGNFGNLTGSTGSVTSPFRFTSREFDTETNLQFSRARYYDSSIGRFISEDPIRFRGGINFYRYVGNDPVRFTDPSGYGPTACLQCIYYMFKCTTKGRECRANLDKKYPTDLQLLEATGCKDTDEAYFKVCWLQNPDCQKKLKYCGECSLWPSFYGDPHFNPVSE